MTRMSLNEAVSICTKHLFKSITKVSGGYLGIKSNGEEVHFNTGYEVVRVAKNINIQEEGLMKIFKRLAEEPVDHAKLAKADAWINEAEYRFS